MPGFDDLNPDSPWQPPSADMEQAKKLMGEVASPKKNITLYINDSPGHKDIAVAIQAAWKELGITSTIKQQEFQQYLEFLGPPPNADVDVYRLGWIGDFVDAINFLDLWTCKSGNNNTNFCDKDYDAVIQKAKNTVDTDARYKLYGEAEDILGGENGQMPVMPIYWYTYVNLERENVKASFSVNLLNQTDLTQVVVTE
jgi:oligopeptide transport system substrate-binding protein